MVQRRQRERSLFEVLLPDGHKLWPDWLRRIDTLLEDEAVIDTVVAGARSAMAAESSPRPSRDAGRGRAADADPEASVRLELRRPGARGAREFGLSRRSRASMRTKCRTRRRS